jgi:squalene-hopene/tetraprenyl-beta-curcumene cyclase
MPPNTAMRSSAISGILLDTWFSVFGFRKTESQSPKTENRKPKTTPVLSVPKDRLDRAYQTALDALLAERAPEGYWLGELSSSALSTATAVAALALVQKHRPPHEPYRALIDGGLNWLARHQNADGGWGDTVKSFSNISTTMLGRAAIHLAAGAIPFAECLGRADRWLGERFGAGPEEQAEAVRNRYGKDRTFAVPILTTCALAGLVSWREVEPLPFELACLPQSWFRFLRLHVVSYALPALIAIGQAVFHHRPPSNPITRWLRRLARGGSLKVLQAIQPSSGGFLEATPLTSFVTLSLAACGLADHPVAKKGADFLVKSVRADGSWPIDTNLSTWVTTLALNALAAAGELENLDRKQKTRTWLLKQQYRERHPYTGAAPGGWAWTDLPGGVPDADDTPGALLALSHLTGDAELSTEICSTLSVKDPGPSWYHLGLDWLLDLQNADGGWPTFCRGWGRLPFDRSGCDLTAHALRVIACWLKRLHLTDYRPQAIERVMGKGPPQIRKWRRAIDAGLEHLTRTQRPDGSWLPLWFGNQHGPDDENPTYGTARVLAAYRDLNLMSAEPARRGVAWLLAAQNPDGGWGGVRGSSTSIEETALALDVLVDAGPDCEPAVSKGLAWLIEQVEAGRLHDPAPIGFYFAKLWYFEKLYPIIFTVAALGRARKKL